MNQQYAYFDELPLKTVFHCNGNKLKKISKRTALVLDPSYARVFTYCDRDLCIVGEYTRIASDYFQKV